MKHCHPSVSYGTSIDHKIHCKRHRGGQRMSFVISILKKINSTGVLTAQDITRDAQSKDGEDLQSPAPHSNDDNEYSL